MFLRCLIAFLLVDNAFAVANKPGSTADDTDNSFTKPKSDGITGLPCKHLGHCKKPSDKWPSTDHECLGNVCVRHLTPGEFGCKSDRQCNLTCKESHCEMNDPKFRNEAGEFQCICNANENNGGLPMYLYAHKCWKECPTDNGIVDRMILRALRPQKEGNLWICQDTSYNQVASRYEASTRHKRQSRFFC